MHNCRSRVRRWWGDDFDIYYSIDYPGIDDVSSTDSDSQGSSGEKKREKAKRRRARGPANHLPRYETKLRGRKAAGTALNAPLSESDFTNPALPRIYSPGRDPDESGFIL